MSSQPQTPVADDIDQKLVVVPDTTSFRFHFSRFARSWLGLAGLIVFIILALVAIFAPLIAPYDPYDLSQLDIMNGRLAPGQSGWDGREFLLGTDDQGRDILSAIIYGLRISLAIGVGTSLAAAAIGSALGLAAAFFGKRVDAIVMRAVDLQLSFPSVLVALILLAFLGKGVSNVVLALIIVEWAYYARTARGAAISELRKEYLEAASGLAIPTWRIIFRHLLPNCLPPLIVITTVQIARAISLEATLSFLGVGVPVTQPSLGLLISNGYQYIFSGEYWLIAFPGLMLLVLIFSVNLVGDRLRDVLNPKESS